MTLTHQEARAAIQQALDSPLEASLQSRLDAHLAGCAECSRYAGQMQRLDSRLAQALPQRWAEAPLPERVQPETRRSSMRPQSSSILSLAGWGALAVLLVLALSWSIRYLVPANAVSNNPTLVQGAQPEESATPTPLPADMMPVPTDLSPVQTEVACENIEYEVQQGDTVIQIAFNFGVPVEELREINGMSAESLIAVGQKLIIPLCQRPTPTPLPPPEGSVPITAGSSVSLFPNARFAIVAAQPEVPQQVLLYRHQIADEAVSPAAAQEMAARLGVQGEAYSSLSEGMEYILTVADGISQVLFMNFNDHFVYTGRYQTVLENAGPAADAETQAAVVERLLQNAGLLDLPYRAELLVGGNGEVHFIPLLEDGSGAQRLLRFGIGYNPGLSEWVQAEVTADGQVSQLYYNGLHLQPLEEAPILSAAQAWERLSGPRADQVSLYGVTDTDQRNTYRSWIRTYPVDQPVDLYGYASTLASATAGEETLATFNNFTLSGVIPTPENPWDFLHVQGVLEDDGSGGQKLTINTWEVSALQDDFLSGSVIHDAGQAYLESEGRRLLLPDFPPDAPEGEAVNVRGVVLPGEPATLDWSFVDAGTLLATFGYTRTCGGGGGGGGGGSVPPASFGGGNLLPVIIEPGPRQPTATPEPGPLALGSRLAGVDGTLEVTQYRMVDGSSRWDFLLIVPPGDVLPYGAALKLEGAVVGLEGYGRLPVRVEGVVDRIEEGNVIVALTSYEPIYPGLSVQAYVGKQSLETLDGAAVIVLTTESGERYVLHSSIDFGQTTLIGRAEDLVEFEGYAVPGHTFGGLPVLVETSGQVPPDGIVDSAVLVLDQNNEPGLANEMVTGLVTIDKIELAYDSISIDRCPPGATNDPFLAQFLVVQPVWVFSGQTADGRLFEVIVQALPDEYLP